MPSKLVEVTTTVAENEYDMKKRLGIPTDARIESIEPITVGMGSIRGVTIVFKKRHRTRFLKNGSWR